MKIPAMFALLFAGAVALEVKVSQSNYPPVFSQLIDYAKAMESGLMELNPWNMTIVGVEGGNLVSQTNKTDGDNVVFDFKYLSLDAATLEGTTLNVSWSLHGPVKIFNLNAKTSEGKEVKIELATSWFSSRNKIITSFTKSYDTATIPTLLTNLPKVEANQGPYFDFLIPYRDNLALDLAIGNQVAKDVSINLPLVDYVEGKPLTYLSDGPVTFKKAGLWGTLLGLFGQGSKDLTIGPLKLDIAYDSANQSFNKVFNPKA